MSRLDQLVNESKKPNIAKSVRTWCVSLSDKESFELLRAYSEKHHISKAKILNAIIKDALT